MNKIDPSDSTKSIGYKQTVIQTNSYSNKQLFKQTVIQTNRHSNKQVFKQTVIKTNSFSNKQFIKHTVIQTNSYRSEPLNFWKNKSPWGDRGEAQFWISRFQGLCSLKFAECQYYTFMFALDWPSVRCKPRKWRHPLW